MTPRALVVLFALLSLPAAAQLRNQVAVSGGWTSLAGIGGARAVGASYDRFVTPYVSAQLGAFRAAARRTRLTDVHAAAAFHPLPEAKLSPWIGLGAARITFDNSGVAHTKLTPTAVAGLDLNISRRFALGAQFHYAELEINPRDRFGLSPNPATWSLAARWRF